MARIENSEQRAKSKDWEYGAEKKEQWEQAMHSVKGSRIQSNEHISRSKIRTKE